MLINLALDNTSAASRALLTAAAEGLDAIGADALRVTICSCIDGSEYLSATVDIDGGSVSVDTRGHPGPNLALHVLALAQLLECLPDQLTP